MRISAVISLLIIVAIAACTGGGATSPTTQATAPATAPATQAASPTAEMTDEESPTAGMTDGGGEITVDVADSDLGEILVDGEGKTLYLFMPDEGGEPTCYDQCAANWPALTVEDEIVVGEGLDDSDFSTVERTDGGTQVRVGDWPLYYFANDAAPGDTNGQGINDVWFVVSPDGEPIQ